MGVPAVRVSSAYEASDSPVRGYNANWQIVRLDFFDVNESFSPFPISAIGTNRLFFECPQSRFDAGMNLQH